MTRSLPCLVFGLTIGALVGSCGGDPPPPEGFHLEIRLVSVAPTVLDRIELRFEPQGTDEQFMAIEPLSYEDGAIGVRVDADRLILTIDGAHGARFATDAGMGAFVYDLELWSDDERPRSPAPTVRAVGLRAGEAIAEGFVFLPAWPLPLGQTSRLRLECRMAAADRCAR